MKQFLLLMLPFFLIAEERVIDLQKLGKIIYHFEEGRCEKIVRLTPLGEVRYEHLYHYDNHNRLISESLIGTFHTIEYSGSLEDECLIAHTPFGNERWSKEDQCIFKEIDIERSYDEQGRLIQKGSNHYFYEQDKLVLVVTDQYQVFFAYDDEGRKALKKTVSEYGEEEEYYLYLGKNEIGSLSKNGELKWLRIPGMTNHPDLVRAIAIETNDAVYAPIYDIRWNIVKLVNIENGVIFETKPDPFGQNLSNLKGCPWTFCSKRYDSETGLIDFGYRNYDPELREWITRDPLIQDSNPYRYCFNNPLQYLDPDGQAAFVIPLLTWTGAAIFSPLWGPGALAVAGGAAAGYLSYKAYKGYQYLQEKNDVYKKPKSGISGKEGSKDAPSWAKGKRPFKWESGKDFAKRLSDDKYGENNYDPRRSKEYSQLKKYGDRAFE